VSLQIKPVTSADFRMRLEENNVGFQFGVEQLIATIIIAWVSVKNQALYAWLIQLRSFIIQGVFHRTGKLLRSDQKNQHLIILEVHNCGQSFVLCSYTMHELRNGNLSIGLFCR